MNIQTPCHAAVSASLCSRSLRAIRAATECFPIDFTNSGTVRVAGWKVHAAISAPRFASRTDWMSSCLRHARSRIRSTKLPGSECSRRRPSTPSTPGTGVNSGALRRLACSCARYCSASSRCSSLRCIASPYTISLAVRARRAWAAGRSLGRKVHSASSDGSTASAAGCLLSALCCLCTYCSTLPCARSRKAARARRRSARSSAVGIRARAA
mmetsp:Transcript_37967/g.87690  ORF Transcript_37967/g.87690 Transcript_37967/m.87690 type:complete len:212 (+) Transcript_37967:138-773(+)